MSTNNTKTARHKPLTEAELRLVAAIKDLQALIAPFIKESK